MSQISVIHSSLQTYSKSTDKKYNLIVTNPPYFEQSLKSSDEQRSFARHADVLPFEELIDGVIKLLDIKGKFCLILPTLEAEKFKLETELKILNFIYEYIFANKDLTNLSPSTMGVGDVSLSLQIQKLRELQAQRQRLQFESKATNPQLISLEQEIDNSIELLLKNFEESESE